MGIIGMVIGVALNAFLPIGATIAIFALINLLSFLVRAYDTLALGPRVHWR